MLRTNLATRPFYNEGAVRLVLLGLGLVVVAATLFNVATSNDQFALLPGYIDGPSGDLRLRPDPAATVPLAAMPGWAWAPVDQYTQPLGSAEPWIPRRLSAPRPKPVRPTA